jgi:hypothetical protein
LFFFKQQFKILYMVRQLPIGLITALAILIGGDNTAFSANHLSCSALGPIVGKMVKQHLVVRNIDTNIRQRIADIYIKRIDPSRTFCLMRSPEYAQSSTTHSKMSCAVIAPASTGSINSAATEWHPLSRMYDKN